MTEQQQQYALAIQALDFSVPTVGTPRWARRWMARVAPQEPSRIR